MTNRWETDMAHPQAPTRLPSDDEQPAGHGSSKLPWILAGWLVLSILAVVGALVLNRDPKPSQKSAAGLPGAGLSPAVLAPGTLAAGAQPPATAGSRDQGPASGSAGWTLRFVYTAVERFHHGRPTRITGCSSAACTTRTTLGPFPSDFVSVVKAQGSGLISSGRQKGRYLDWNPDVGYWIDMAARDWGTAPFTKFATARTVSPLLPLGTHLTIALCGPSARPNAAAACSKLRSRSWTVVSTGRPSARRDVWLYVGPETGPGADGMPWVGTYRHATLRIG